MFLVPMSRSSELARSFDRLFDESFERFFAPSAQTVQGSTMRSPALDVAESETAYTVSVDLPGVAKEDVKVSIDGRRVSVEAQTRNDVAKKDGERVVYRERSMASFARSFTVATDIDQSASAAKLEDGVLTLTLCKRGAPASAQLTIN